MSTEVYIQSVRKSDCCPFDKVFLGQYLIKRKLESNLSFEATVMGSYVHLVGNLEKAMAFMVEYKETVETGGGYTNALDDYNSDFPDDFTFWIIIEE